MFSPSRRGKPCIGVILSYVLCCLIWEITVFVSQSILQNHKAPDCNARFCHACRSWWLRVWEAGCVTCAAKAEIKGGRRWEHQPAARWAAAVVQPHKKREAGSDLPFKMKCVMNKCIVGFFFSKVVKSRSFPPSRCGNGEQGRRGDLPETTVSYKPLVPWNRGLQQPSSSSVGLVHFCACKWCKVY